MSGHTKGPWSLNGHFNVTASGRGVATCGGWQDGKEGTFDENCANARLIAAAPDGKALAERVMECSADCPLSVVDLARAFLAKAEGRE